jgi:hypothetical protein
MKIVIAAATVLILSFSGTSGQNAAHARASDAAGPEIPVLEVALAGGDLRVINLFGLQARILEEGAGAAPEALVERLVREVYAPYPEFWAGYLGDESAFRRWAPGLLAPDHPIHARVEKALGLDLDGLFGDAVEWLERTTARRPTGRWYILFGPGWANMGGLRDGRMFVDFSNMSPDRDEIVGILPHELAHQIHNASAPSDPDRDTVLGRIISEGLACYVAWVHASGQRSPAWAVSYQEREWDWAIEHEDALWEAASAILTSRERADTDRVSHRGRQLIPGSPGAAGYFLGLRIVEAYVAARGPDAWQEIFDLPVAEVLARSGYVRP